MNDKAIIDEWMTDKQNLSSKSDPIEGKSKVKQFLGCVVVAKDNASFVPLASKLAS